MKLLSVEDAVIASHYDFTKPMTAIYDNAPGNPSPIIAIFGPAGDQESREWAERVLLCLDVCRGVDNATLKQLSGVIEAAAAEIELLRFLTESAEQQSAQPN